VKFWQLYLSQFPRKKFQSFDENRRFLKLHEFSPVKKIEWMRPGPPIMVPKTIQIGWPSRLFGQKNWNLHCPQWWTAKVWKEAGPTFNSSTPDGLTNKQIRQNNYCTQLKAGQVTDPFNLSSRFSLFLSPYLHHVLTEHHFSVTHLFNCTKSRVTTPLWRKLTECCPDGKHPLKLQRIMQTSRWSHILRSHSPDESITIIECKSLSLQLLFLLIIIIN